ncbi:hypothetical protein B0T17DRAFT_179104 [Bombardia bombarda]|uniref:Uncharacterized protein n=1 Tax=Bombardia bombarda TaxID=252184 RepID=A0AA40C8R4_9PEZI|nr:hypothetical protein B0T17DRAFT_179104 [Bombardia bombarda]
MPSLNTPAPIRNSLPTASGSQTRGHSWQRQGRRPINTIRIAPDERLVEVKFLTAGGEWVVLPKALISPRYPQCFVPAQTAVAIGHWPKDLEGAEIQTYVTPRGYVKSTSAVVLWFELEQLSLPLSLVKLPVLGGDNLGVSIILGSPFIIWCFGSNWPPSNPLHAEEYVSGGWVSHSNYGGYATTGSMEEGADTCRCQGQYQCYCGRSNAG